MADVAVEAGETLLIEVEMTAGSGTYSHPALINTTRGFALSTSESVTKVADAANQALPAKTIRVIKDTDLVINGAGKLDAPSSLAYIQWLKSGVAKNVRVRKTLAGSLGGWTAQGTAVLTDYNESGEAREKLDVTLTIKQASDFTFTANAG